MRKKTKTNRKKYRMRRRKTRRKKQRGGVSSIGSSDSSSLDLYNDIPILSQSSSPEEVVLRPMPPNYLAPKILPLDDVPYGISYMPNKAIGNLTMTNLSNAHIYGYNPRLHNYLLRRWNDEYHGFIPRPLENFTFSQQRQALQTQLATSLATKKSREASFNAQKNVTAVKKQIDDILVKKMKSLFKYFKEMKKLKFFNIRERGIEPIYRVFKTHIGKKILDTYELFNDKCYYYPDGYTIEWTYVPYWYDEFFEILRINNFVAESGENDLYVDFTNCTQKKWDEIIDGLFTFPFKLSTAPHESEFSDYSKIDEKYRVNARKMRQ